MGAVVGEPRLAPHAVYDGEPVAGPRIAVVMRVELQAIASGLVGPPGRHHVQAQATAADPVDIGGLFGQLRRMVKCRADGDHQLQPVGDGGQRRRGRPGIERRRVGAFDVIQRQLGDQRQIVTDLLAAPHEPGRIVPARIHALVRDVAQPAAEHGQPISIAHRTTPRGAWPRRRAIG